MTRTLSALVTAISDVLTTRGTSDDQLLLWAKTEYGNDWQYAYRWMKENPGSVPFTKTIKTEIKKEQKHDEYFGVQLLCCLRSSITNDKKLFCKIN